MRLSYITLAVTDFPSMFVFYQALGLPVHKLGKDPERPFAMFAMGSLILALYPKALLAKQAGCTIEGDNSALSLSLNVADKSEVNVTLELALAHGARITRTPFQPEWGAIVDILKTRKLIYGKSSGMKNTTTSRSLLIFESRFSV